MNDTIKLLQSHRSIRRYTDKPIEEEMLREIIKSAQCASTSSFIQAYSIISVENKENRKKISELGGKQAYIMECPVFLVFCADLSRLKRACDSNGQEFDGGYTESFLVATVDTALAAQNAMVAAESLGLGGVYIGGIRNNPDKIADILKLPENCYPLVGMCLGYPADNSGKKERLPLEVVFKKDEYVPSQEEEKLSEYDERIKLYYNTRTGGQRQDTWSGQVAEKLQSNRRPHMKRFLEDRGFILK
ncbi:MAG: oxygen-insensitive NADPH nitroreductase [Clostridiaceae bacterium]